MARKGRSAAILLGALCAAVLAGGAVLFRARIVEEWYFWKLRSADPAESDRAALKLGEMGSLRAVEPLIEAIRREKAPVVTYFGGAGFQFRTHSSIRTVLLPEKHGLELAPKAYALYQMGAGALSLIERTLESESETLVDSWLDLEAVRDAIQGKYSQVELEASADRIWESYRPPTSP